MFAEWSVEAGVDDPLLVVPWKSEPASGINATDPLLITSGPSCFIDLRENPYDLDQISEAEQHPVLMQALRALNATRSPFFTAKCDAWQMEADDLATTQLNLDVPPEQAPYGFASYIDLVWRQRSLFVSFHQSEQRLTRMCRMLEPLDLPYAAAECVLRPALVDLPEAGSATDSRAQEGFAASLYVKALGTDRLHAYEHWGQALQAVTAILRAKEFSIP